MTTMCPAVSPKKICAFNHPRFNQPPASACYGDSGGPLTVSNDEGYAVVIGVVSYIPQETRQECSGQKASIFTKVQAYLPWIKSITGIGEI